MQGASVQQPAHILCLSYSVIIYCESGFPNKAMRNGTVESHTRSAWVAVFSFRHTWSSSATAGKTQGWLPGPADPPQLQPIPSPHHQHLRPLTAARHCQIPCLSLWWSCLPGQRTPGEPLPSRLCRGLFLSLLSLGLSFLPASSHRHPCWSFVITTDLLESATVEPPNKIPSSLL